MKQITIGKINEKMERALDKAVPSWYDYSYTIQTIGDIFFIDMTVASTDKVDTTQVFMDIDRFDARRAVKVEIC